MTKLRLVLSLGAALALAADVCAAELAAYYSLLTVGCGGVVDDGVGAVVFHPDIALVDRAEAARIEAAFLKDDTVRCLKAILETDLELTARVRAQSTLRGSDLARLHADVYSAWEKFGVAKALEEVATRGARGPQTAALLHRCAALPNFAGTLVPVLHGQTR